VMKNLASGSGADASPLKVVGRLMLLSWTKKCPSQSCLGCVELVSQFGCCGAVNCCRSVEMRYTLIG
jgi:hypothetical protein